MRQFNRWPNFIKTSDYVGDDEGTSFTSIKYMMQNYVFVYFLYISGRRQKLQNSRVGNILRI